MDINYRQFKSHFKQPTLHSYWLSSDETFLLQHTTNAIKKKAVKLGYDTSHFTLSQTNHWHDLKAIAASGQLFNNKRCILVHSSQKLNAKFSQQWLSFLTTLSADLSMHLISSRVTAAQKKTQWFKQLLKQHTHISIWPLNEADYSAWLKQQISDYPIKLDANALQTLASISQLDPRITINVLEKLSLIFEKGVTINTAQLVANSSEIQTADCFGVSQMACLGQTERCLALLSQLPEHTSTLMSLWGIFNQILSLAQRIYTSASQNHHYETYIKQYARGLSEQQRMRHLLQRHNPQSIHQLQESLWQLELRIKGIKKTAFVWLDLKQFLMDICGHAR